LIVSEKDQKNFNEFATVNFEPVLTVVICNSPQTLNGRIVKVGLLVGITKELIDLSFSENNQIFKDDIAANSELMFIPLQDDIMRIENVDFKPNAGIYFLNTQSDLTFNNFGLLTKFVPQFKVLFNQSVVLTEYYFLFYREGTNTVGTAPSPPVEYAVNSPVVLLDNTGPFTNSDPTKVFYGWNTAIDGTGTEYDPGSILVIQGLTILFAQWVYVVSYDGNGATDGTLPDQAVYRTGVPVLISGQGTLLKPGFTFLGWNSSPAGDGNYYAPGYTFNASTTTLYAQWAPGVVIKNCGGGTLLTGSGAMSITYAFPFAKIIQSSDTVTIFTTALLGTTTSNYGSGAAPLGIISIASKTVITQEDIKINVNTAYLDPTDSHIYSLTITNGVDITYWSFGATISSITFPTLNATNSIGIPTYSVSTTSTVDGCGLTAFTDTFGAITNTHTFLNQSLKLNFSDGKNTTFFISPNNAFYTHIGARRNCHIRLPAYGYTPSCVIVRHQIFY
jgi:hypothetical protein